MTDEPGNRIPPMKHLNINGPVDIALVRVRERIEDVVGQLDMVQRYLMAVEQHLWKFGMFQWITAFCCGGGFGFLIALFVLTRK